MGLLKLTSRIGLAVTAWQNRDKIIKAATVAAGVASVAATSVARKVNDKFSSSEDDKLT